jgi:hypothetical protein
VFSWKLVFKEQDATSGTRRAIVSGSMGLLQGKDKQMNCSGISGGFYPVAGLGYDDRAVNRRKFLPQFPAVKERLNFRQQSNRTVCISITGRVTDFKRASARNISGRICRVSDAGPGLPRSR